MKKFFMISLFLLVLYSNPWLSQEIHQSEIRSENLKMEDLFVYKVEYKENITLGTPAVIYVKLTYQGDEPIFINVSSKPFFKSQNGKLQEFDYYTYNRDCLETEAEDCMAPSSPIKLQKGDTYDTGIMLFHKGNGHLYFEEPTKIEICFSIGFYEVRFGRLGEKIVKGKIPSILTKLYNLTVQEPQGQDAQVWTEITNNGLKPFLSPYDSGMMGCMIKDPAKLSALEKVIQNYPNALLTDRLRLGYALALLERGKGDPMKNWEKANTLIDSVRNKDEEYYRTLLGDFEYYGFKESVKAKINEKIKIIYKDLSGNAAFADFLKEWKAKKERQQRTLINERSKYEIEERLKEEKRKREERRKQSAKEGK